MHCHDVIPKSKKQLQQPQKGTPTPEELCLLLLLTSYLLVYYKTLKIEAACSSEMLVNSYKSTQCLFPEDSTS
jgi:hypothetical protein